MDNSGYIYLIYDECVDACKIGVSKGLKQKRLNALQTGNSTSLRILYTYSCAYPYRLETMLHNYYKENHIKNEWFYLTPQQISSFTDTCEKLNRTIQSLIENPYFSKGLK